ncbi:MAG: tetratricopeptide repeat protein [bacterium]
MEHSSKRLLLKMALQFLVLGSCGCFSSYDNQMFLGDRYYDTGEFEIAADAFRNAILIDPKKGTAYYRLGECFLATGQTEDAVYAFEKVIEVDNTLAGLAAYELALIYLQENTLDTANFYCLKTLSENPNLIKAYATYGNIQNGMGRFDKAIEFVLRGLSFQPRQILREGLQGYRDDRAALFNTLGKSFSGMGRWEFAVVAFDSAAKYTPQWHIPVYNKAEEYEAQGRFLQAEDIYDGARKKGWPARELNPRAARMYYHWGKINRSIALLEQLQHAEAGNITLLMTLGRLYEFVGKHSDALMIYNLAMLEDTLAAAPHYYLGRLCASGSNYSSAIQHFRQAMTLDPSYPGSYLHAGVLYFQQEKYEEAQVMFKQAAALDTLSAEAYLNLAFLSLAKEKIALASSYFYTAQNLFLRFGGMPAASDELELLFDTLIQNER